MECRAACGACCIAPSIARPYYGMPAGKRAGEACVHLDEAMRCGLFDDPRRPLFCATFIAETLVCGNNREEALHILAEWEVITLPPESAPGMAR